MFNHSSGIDFQKFNNLYKKCAEKPYSFLVIDTALVSEFFTFQKESFIKNINVNHDNWWKHYRGKSTE